MNGPKQIESPDLNKFLVIYHIQWNSVTKQSLGPTKSVCYNQVYYCTKFNSVTVIFVRNNRVFALTEFFITELQCILNSKNKFLVMLKIYHLDSAGQL
jgi:hypothetical protein